MNTARESDMVIFTMSRWDGEVSSAILSLARELARHRRVFYWDHPYSFKDLLKDWNHPGLQDRRSHLMQGKLWVRSIPGMPEGFRAVTPPLTWPVNWMAPGSGYERGSRLNDRILNRALKQLVEREQIHRYLFLNSFDPFFFRRIDPGVAPMIRIYQSRDDITQEAYIARHGPYLEREQLEQADLRLATSQGLSRLLEEKYQLQVDCLPNGADVALFGQALEPGPKPADWPVPPSSRPLVGYIGNLSGLRMDYPLLRRCVEDHPDKDFLLLGNAQPEDTNLAACSNVYCLGSRPLVSLPAYLRPVDVAIIPFKFNTLTRSIYPLKINEYLAAGKPVLSTGFSEDVRDFAPVVELADDPATFSARLNNALADRSAEALKRRTEWAAKNSWTVRRAQFEALVERALDQKQERSTTKDSPE